MIYIVFECDEHCSYNSYVIKEIFTNKAEALSFYNKGKKHYSNVGEKYILNLAVHTKRLNLSLDNNVLRDLIIMKSTLNGIKTASKIIKNKDERNIPTKK